jgi:branched-chain amino acid transport system ATP-binding protein
MMLSITDLHLYYGAIHALKGISINIGAGEIVTLIGANGAGKSTTLMAISGALKPSKGSIHFEGSPIHTRRAHEIVQLGICQAPEGRRIFPLLTVAENLAMGAFTRRDYSGISHDIDRVFSLFPILKERRKQRGGTLSGGEQQMLAIGRALMGNPKLLLLDEPSLGLAPILVERVFEKIADINKEGVTILLVEQNAHMALNLAHRGYVIETGCIAVSGTSPELRHNPDVKKAYLGEN